MTDATAPVSVVIPCFLCRDTIERALLSVVQQTVRPREVLLIDDASPDGGETVLELQRLADLHGALVSIIVVRSPENGGPGSARNRGWELAGQPFIAFLDADDAWFLEKIETQYTWMQNHPEYFLTCHHDVFIKKNGQHSFKGRVSIDSAPHHLISGLSLLYFNSIATRTVMLRRDLPYRFEDGKRYSEDYLLWLEMVLNGVHAAKIDLSLAMTFKPAFGAGGLSGSLLRMQLGELYCYRTIYKANLIGAFPFIACSSFSLIKFARRIILSTLQRLKAEKKSDSQSA